MRINSWMRAAYMGIVIVLLLSGCDYFKKTPSEQTVASSAYPSPQQNIGDENTALEPTVQITSTSVPESAYPAPTGESQGSQEGTPYPGQVVVAPQGAAYPAPLGGSQQTPASANIRPPSQVTSNPNAYPVPGTPVAPAQSTPVAATTQSAQPVAGGLTSTLTTTPGIIRTNIIPSDPTMVKLASGRLQLVEFFGYWCTLCKSMAPVVNLLEMRYGGLMNFAILDVDDPRITSFEEALGYTLIAKPHFYLLDGDGKVVQEWVGYIPVEDLEAAIKPFLS